MRKTLCIIACIVAAFASLFTLAACTETGTDGRTYYSVAVDGGTGSGKYDAGAVCQVEAVVPEGMQFMKWLKNGQEVSVNPVYKFEVTENSRLVAVFGDGVADTDKEVCVISVKDGYGGGGYFVGSPCTIKIPDAEMDRNFKGWAKVTEDVVSDTVLSDKKTYTFTVSESLVLQPVYNDVRLTAPDNSNDQMIKFVVSSSDPNMVHFDRQKDASDNPVTAFAEGVAAVRYYIYRSTDLENPVTYFELAPDGEGKYWLQDGSGNKAKFALDGEPGNFYYNRDGWQRIFIKNVFKAASGYDWGTGGETYRIACQAISADPEHYVSSGIGPMGSVVGSSI